MGNGPSSLHQAALAGEINQVRLAIQERPDSIDATEPTNGWTALHISASKGYEVIVRELLARGAAPNLVDKEGRTALHLSAGQGHVSVIRDLLRKGADPVRRDTAGQTPLDIALEQQQPAAASMFAEALAGRGPTGNTPTDSPTTAQGQPGFPFGVRQPDMPSLAGLNMADAPPLVGGTYPPAGGGGSAYPSVPAPSGGSDWLQRLPVPPAGGGVGIDGPVSMAAPSAPPASRIYPAPQQQQQQQQQQQAQYPWQQPQQQQQQQQQAAVDYYDYIRPSPPSAAPPAPAVATGSSPYPAVPPAAPSPSAAYPPMDRYQQQQQQQAVQHQHQQQQVVQPQQQQQQQQHLPPVPEQRQQQQRLQAGGSDADSDDGWGGGAGDDWGDEDDDSRPSASSAAAAAGRSQQKQGPSVNVNAAVGAAVSGAGKVAGAVGSIAVAGAKQFLTGLIPRPPGKGGNDDSSAPGFPSSAAAATWAGTPGRTYTYGELAAATQGFSDANKLGAGGYGPVYRGVLDGLPVAVKLLDPAATGGQQGPKEFQSEVAILSRLHHPHIVLLIGSCPERCALVYELMDYGSLEHHLFNPSMPELAWQDRVRMACEVASALVFLHSAPEPIIHMDLKPGNLLINRSLLCKVGDVGLSRLMPGARGRTAGGSPMAGGPVSTVMDSRLVGTPCYMDPEYLRTGRYGPKSDVYSMGVILLQMLTGLEASRAVGVVEAALARSQHDAASFATIIDPRSGSWPITEAASFAHLAVRCVQLQRAQRPDLRGEVLPALLQLGERSKLYSSAASVKRSLSLSHSSSTPPSMMICPITQDVMEDPVFAADGYTYERIAIAAWMSNHNTSPMTNLPLSDSRLTPNLALRSAIKEWQERQSSGNRR